MKKYKVLKGKVIDSVSGRHESEYATLNDNMAHFYRRQIELVKPDSSNTVKEIKDYLDHKGIEYKSDDKKEDLLNYVEELER